MQRVEVEVVDKDWRRARDAECGDIAFALVCTADVTAWDIHVAPCGQMRVFVNVEANVEAVVDALFRFVSVCVMLHGTEVHHVLTPWGQTLEYRFSWIPGVVA